MTTPPALLIAGTGTRDEGHAAAFHDFVGELAARRPDLPVAGGLIGPGSHPLSAAVTRLIGEGVTRFAVVPLTLNPAACPRDGIASALAREAERHADASFACAPPLGPHPTLLGVLERRLDEALGNRPRLPSDRAETTVLLVSDGSPHPEANAEVHRAARLLWEGRGFAGVEVAFASLAAPDVTSALDRCAKLGARRVVLLPYFLFAGDALERVRQQAEGWGLAHPEVEVVSADVIGPAWELADLVMERYEDATRTAGTAGAAESAGIAGQSGAAGTAGSARIAGTGRSAGTAGSTGTAGSAGTAGIAGTGRSVGAAGTARTAGTAGTGRSAGTAGAADEPHAFAHADARADVR
ncbi:CbiX/SirB N-terminal domain-containing protein [Streptomyces hygroscopicus]|uniref:sirohydrochlorin chelatase n=1 Tax=Streptomyces hygroscopicus TaxID=1912 RepID=UPI003639DBAC